MTNQIKAKVAQVLNSREMVINKGANAGVTQGMQFSVLNSKGQRVIDPETKVELGSLNLEKARVKVTKVYENMSICSTFRIRGGGFSSGFYGNVATDLFKLGKPVVETFETDAEIIKEIDTTNLAVQIGDDAHQILESNSQIFPSIENAKAAIRGMHENEMQYQGDWRPPYVQLDLLSAFEKALLTFIELETDSEVIERCRKSRELISELKNDLRAEAFGFLANSVSAVRFEEMTDAEVSNALRPEKLGGMVSRHTGMTRIFEEELSSIFNLVVGN